MRILVVEDEHRVANAIKKGLEQEKYAVDVAYTGTDGFDLASTEEYDTIILDIMLPGIDGLTICRDLRAREIHTPIIMLTAKSQIDDKIIGLDIGADDYLAKPFSFEELLARVRALIRRPNSYLPDRLAVRGLMMDLTGYAVERLKKKIALSSKEFSLLEYLMRNCGKVITKQQIIGHVWNYDADILPNTVEVYIKRLRKKIDLPFKTHPPLIHTVRGFGYKLE